MRKILAFLALLFLGFLASSFWAWNLLYSETKLSQALHHEPSKGQGLNRLIDDLHAKGVVQHPTALKLYMKWTGKSKVQQRVYFFKCEINTIQNAKILSYENYGTFRMTIQECRNQWEI